MRSNVSILSTILIVFLVFNFDNAAAVFDLNHLQLLDPPANNTRSSGRTDFRILENQYFEQRLDHFNPIDTRTYQQRYHLSEEYYYPNASNQIFLLLGGEWEATPSWLSGGAWVHMASEYGALLIYLEHRFYGVSQPFEDLSNMQYLNAHQALADAASFIIGINQMYNLTNTQAKWIAFGGSYAGTLAAWLRQKYPHLVAGAVDSSGPLEAVLDFHAYYQVVRESLETHSTDCTTNIQTAFQTLEELVLTTDGPSEIESIFQLCNPLDITNEKDVSWFFSSQSTPFAYVTQYHGFLALTINDLCDIMVNETIGIPLYRLAAVSARYRSSCLDHRYDSFITYLQNTTIVASNIYRQWMYQTCTEYGFYQTSSQPVDPIFSSQVPVSVYVDMCIDAFGSEFNETLISMGIQSTNKRYGATDAITSNVVHWHGRIDPWHALGKLETVEGLGNHVLMVDDAAHCASMYNWQNPSAQMAESQVKIRLLVGEWLGVLASSSAKLENVFALNLVLVTICTFVSKMFFKGN